MRASTRLLALALALAAAPALAGCLDSEWSGSAASDEVGGPGFHVRSTDFYHSYRAAGESYTDSFSWSCPEGKARLEVRHGLASGVEKVTVKDANGATVFSEDFSKGTREGEFHPGTGAPGEWTITIERRDAVGQFDLHVWRDIGVA